MDIDRIRSIIEFISESSYQEHGEDVEVFLHPVDQGNYPEGKGGNLDKLPVRGKEERRWPPLFYEPGRCFAPVGRDAYRSEGRTHRHHVSRTESQVSPGEQI